MKSRSTLWGQAPEVVCFWPVSGWSILGPVSKTCSVLSGQTMRVTCPLHLSGGSMSEKGMWTSRHPNTFPEEWGLSL